MRRLAQGANPVNVQKTIIRRPSNNQKQANGAVTRNHRYFRVNGGAKCLMPLNDIKHKHAGPNGNQMYQYGIAISHGSGKNGSAAAAHVPAAYPVA